MLIIVKQFLVDSGHEDDAFSRNVTWDTPLHLAVETSVPIAVFLATKFPECIPWKNKQGADVVRCPFNTWLYASATLLTCSICTDYALRSHGTAFSSSYRYEPKLPTFLPSSPPNSRPATTPFYSSSSLSHPHQKSLDGSGSRRQHSFALRFRLWTAQSHTGLVGCGSEPWGQKHVFLDPGCV